MAKGKTSVKAELFPSPGAGFIAPTPREAGLLITSACEREDWARLESLLNAGLDPDAPTSEAEGSAILSSLCQKLPASAVELLLSHGANPNTRYTDERSVAMRVLPSVIGMATKSSTQKETEESIKKIELLARYGADFNARAKGDSVLTLALLLQGKAKDGVERAELVVKSLLKGGASPLRIEGDKKDPLTLACSRGLFSCALLLIDAGADPCAQLDNDFTAYERARRLMGDESANRMLAQFQKRQLLESVPAGKSKKAPSI